MNFYGKVLFNSIEYGANIRNRILGTYFASVKMLKCQALETFEFKFIVIEI